MLVCCVRLWCEGEGRCSDGVLTACWCSPQARVHVMVVLLAKHEHSLSEEDMQWVARLALKEEGREEGWCVALCGWGDEQDRCPALASA